MSWLSRLLGKSEASGSQESSQSLAEKSEAVGSRESFRSLVGKRVALAIVVNPQDVKIISFNSPESGSGVSEDMVRDFIEKDLKRYPELRAKAKAIQEIVITEENISSENYAQDMAECYMERMGTGEWATPEGLHIFETFLGTVTVYIAYGT